METRSDTPELMLNRYPISILRCPVCLADVAMDPAGVRCVACGRIVPRVGDALCFTPSAEGHPSEERPDSLIVRVKNVLKRNRPLYNVLLRVFGTSNAGISPERFLADHSKDGHVALNLGAGTQSRYPRTVSVDLFAFSGIDIVADIKRLPFKDDSVDETMCVTVLEHIDDPLAVLREMSRVTKPGGSCFVTVPFVYPFHSSPNDYYRWTREGIRTAATSCGFEEIACGLRHGPTAALFMTFTYWIAIPFSFGSRKLRDVIVIVGMGVLMPFSHVFDLLFDHLAGSDIALGFYFIGRKRA